MPGVRGVDRFESAGQPDATAVSPIRKELTSGRGYGEGKNAEKTAY